MSAPAFTMGLRLRLLSMALSAVGMFAVIVMVGALFPAVGDSIGKLDLPEGVATCSAARTTARSPAGCGARSARSTARWSSPPRHFGAVGSTAGEEEDGILGADAGLSHRALAVRPGQGRGGRVGVVMSPSARSSGWSSGSPSRSAT